MLTCIEHCYNNRLIASFLCNESGAQTILVGYIQRYSNDEVLIAHISPHGIYDGFILKNIDDICRIGYGGDYEKKVEELYNLRKQSHSVFVKDKTTEDDMLYSLLVFAKAYDHIVSVYMFESSVSGFVDSYGDDTVSIRIIDEFGMENGMSTIRRVDILTIAVDSDNEQDLKLLYSTRGLKHST